MNKLILSTVLAASIAAPVSAKTVLYPKEQCAEILSSEYSTAGGDSAINMFEILCKDAYGNYSVFVTSWGSLSGIFGLGRVAFDEVIILKPYAGNTLKVE